MELVSNFQTEVIDAASAAVTLGASVALGATVGGIVGGPIGAAVGAGVGFVAVTGVFTACNLAAAFFTYLVVPKDLTKQ